MISRRSFLGTAAFAAALAPATMTVAAEERTFTRQAFQAAQRRGQSILVAIHASWCPTCAAQKPILARLFAEPKIKD